MARQVEDIIGNAGAIAARPCRCQTIGNLDAKGYGTDRLAPPLRR